MKERLLLLIASLFFLSSFGQTGNLKNLENSKGFEQFIYGTSIKKYQNFKLRPTTEVFQEYVSTIPINYKDVKIDSVELFFFKERLYAINLYIDESERTKMTTELEKLYGLQSSLLRTENESIWNGKVIKLSIGSVGNNQHSVHFENTENQDEREKESIDQLMK